MEENMEQMASGMFGEDSAQMMGMMERMSRLQRLLGQRKEEVPEQIEESTGLFGSSPRERILYAAIPFLDAEFQKNMFVVMRVLEMRRVMTATPLVAREKQEEPTLRRNQMFRAIRPFLPVEERNQIDQIMRMMQMRELMAQKEDLL
ncbi:hypothetical protein [Chakrabartyella piscis]|uniref:hypothetical protein n=1 Tax=Chakrabartyella piscis TaxID=2918914 RepID=UPI00295861FF|nr:hypothetical protein [Chakrabartyella piscis]